MSDPLPELLDPRRAIAAEARYAGSLPIARLRRLGEAVEDDSGDVHYRLRFGKDARGRGVVSGEVDAKLRLRCQRCMGTLWLEVHARPCLALVEGPDEAAELPEEYDPLLLEERLMRAAALIEDELLLAIPPFPRHPEGSCVAPAPPSSGAPSQNSRQQEGGRPNPFAELAALKRRRSD